MKIRTDYVTNSSSSSFILARKGSLSEEAKQAIVSYVESNLLGRPLLEPGASDAEISKTLEDYYFEDDVEEEIRSALKEGKTVYMGEVSFEGEDAIADVYEDVWNIVNREDENFEIIDGDLSY